MADVGSGRSRPKSRGNLHAFYDPKLQESVYGKRESKAKHSQQKVDVEPKRTALVIGSGGRFEIDRKVLVEECAADFSKAWFYKSATRCITHRLDNSIAQPFNPRRVEELPNMPQVTSTDDGGKDLLSRVTQRFEAELVNTKLHNTKFEPEVPSTTGKFNKPPNVATSPNNNRKETILAKPERSEVQDLFYNATINGSIDTFVKRKYATVRTNNANLGVNSPDIILFKECLKKNVLPPASMELQIRTGDNDFNSSYDPSTSTRQLAMMASTLLGKTVPANHNHSLDVGAMGNSITSIAEDDGTYTQLGAQSAQSIGSIDSTDILGIENEQVISINLNNRSIGNERGICLSAALAYCPHLCVIKLANNRLSDRSVSMILKAVFNITYCEELDISSNSVGDRSSECLAEYLQVSHCALRKLNVSKCNIDDENCTRICRSLHANESLEILDISYNNLGKMEEFKAVMLEQVSGCDAIAEILTANSTLRELRVAGNNIHKLHAKTFAQKLASNTSLCYLDLSHNEIHDLEARLLGKALHSHFSLTQLDLSFNSIGSKGAITIAYAAQQPTSSLQYIDLNGNSIGKMGGVYMLRAMRAVAAYPYTDTSKTPSSGPDPTTGAPPVVHYRRMLTIDYQVTVLPHKDENIHDTSKPLKQYTLHLSDPYDYTIARMVLDIADRHPMAAFKSVKYLHPSSHLWEFIHLGRGGLFEPLADPGHTATHVWAEHMAEINTAVAAIQAAQIAEIQAGGGGGPRGGGKRRQAFRAPTASSPSSPSAVRLDSLLPTTEGAASAEHEQTKHFRHKTRHARHVLYRVGLKLGFNFEEEILARIIDRLCRTTVDDRAKLITLLEIIYHELYVVLSERDKSVKAQQDSNLMLLPAAMIANHMSIFGTFKDSELGTLIPAAERAKRLISESDLSEERVHLSMKWYLQLMMSRQVDALPAPSRTFWTMLNTTYHWAVPSEGKLTIELHYPLLCPTQYHSFSNTAMMSLIAQVTHNRDTERALDQIEQVLHGTVNELFLTCAQAEVILVKFTKFKSHSHFMLVESLLYQIISPFEVKRFIVRNLYFSEILSLRRKLNYLFKVLTGNVTGHYLLDLRNEQHRCAASRLAELNNFHQMQMLKRDLNTSQCGTGDCFRNATYNGAYVPLDSAWFLDLPEVGQLRFDYVSPVRPPEGMPPSSGTWGCSFEGYIPNTATTADDTSLYADDEDGVYDAQAQEQAIFSTLQAKEQYVQELVENLFAKKFEPRSKAKRKETRSCPKNMVPAVKYLGGARTGRFVKSVNPFANVVTAANRTAQAAKRSYVDKVKGFGADTADFADSGTEEDGVQATTAAAHHYKEASSSESSDDDYLKTPQSEPEATNSSSTHNAAQAPSAYGRNTKYKTDSVKGPSAAGANSGAVKSPKKTKPVNRFKEVYIQEVTEYWKDTAETSWARCRSNYTDLLKKKLVEVWQEELKDKATDKDINATIPQSAYFHPEYLKLRNSPIFKSANVTRRRARPGTAVGSLPLNYALNSTSQGGKRASLILDNAVVEELAAAVAASIKNTSTEKFVANTGPSTSMKVRSQSAKMGNKGITDSVLVTTATTSSEDGANAAVASKLAFEKFLLRLEVVAMYNMWLTVDQFNVILQALIAHSASVSVVVRAVCVLFNQIVDRSVLYPLISTCPDQFRRELVHRLGILNVWSPLCPDGKIELDLCAYDQREACRLMCFLVHETAHKLPRHEMHEVVHYKDSILDSPLYLTTRNHLRPSGATKMTFAPSVPAAPEDHLPITWTPPDFWSKADPLGPPKHGHLQFTIRTIAAPAYSIM